MRNQCRRMLFLLCSLPFAAQAALPQRTFVASQALDANPCSLIAPCRTFGAAVTAVAAGGEVVALDSAGYGAVAIAKSVSIVTPPGIYAGITVSSGAGVTIDGAGINVVLRGLSVTGGGSGYGAIEFRQGASLHVENCVVSGFASAGLSLVAASATTHVIDTIVRDGAVGFSVYAGAANISRTRVEHNWDAGVRLEGGAVVSIEDSVVTGGSFNVQLLTLFAGNRTRVTIARTLLSGGGSGIEVVPTAANSDAAATIMDSTITGETWGVYMAPIAGSATVMAIRNQLQGNNTALFAMGPAATLILDGNALANNVAGVGSSDGATIVTRGNNTVTSNLVDTVGTPYTSLTGI